MADTIHAVDLFCGAGGTSAGLQRACTSLEKKLRLTAINHWDVAIETHTANHPEASHICETLDSVDPRKAIPRGKLDLLVASPECTHHSNARGGKPMNDQSRASAWHIPRWAGALEINGILIENVKEFRNWGPLGSNGLPLKSRKGETYQAFLNAIRSQGYTVEDKVLNAAHYGDATSRERLFIMCRRGRRPIKWPTPTHSPHGNPTLFGKTERWKTAREIIDWNLKGDDLSKRKRPLADNTMARIEAGLKKFGGPNAEPYLVVLRNNMGARSVDEPVPTITASGKHIGLAEPFVVVMKGTSDAATVDRPLPTVTTKDHLAVCEPFLIPQFTDNPPRSVEMPLNTLTTSSRGVGLVEPYMVAVNHGSEDVDSVDRPLRTVTATSSDMALVEPFVASYYGTGNVSPVSKPLPTVTTKDRFALVEPVSDGVRYGIRFRMLQPHELANAMSFGAGYKFAGGKSEQVKQIGNAVPVCLAAALCREMIQ
jgi:DNA (cytosine-5)-methyltransferase 1